MASDELPPLRDVVREHGLDAKKSLGQNFLFDLNLTGRIARAAGPLEGVHVVEVGPGPGGLTRALLAGGAAHVTAIERDERCAAALEQISAHYPGRLTIVQGDALTFDVAELVTNGASKGPMRIVANLPYNIGTALLTRWIESAQWPPVWDRLVLMFQKEVALRIVATPGQRADYGRLGVLCGWRTQAQILFDVPPEAFTPPPKVTSSVVELVPRADPLPCDLATLSAVTKVAFGQRRKMLRQSLKGLHSGGHAINAQDLLRAADVNEQARAEEIDVAGYVRLANCARAQA